MKLTKKQFDRLYDESITKKEYDEIIRKVDNRLAEILERLFRFSKNKDSWWEYADDEFQPDDCKDYIAIDVEGKLNDVVDYLYYDGIPTRWLWDDGFESEHKKNLDKYNEMLQKEKTLKQTLQKDKIKIHKSIKDKLTKEELKHVQLL